MSAPEPLRFDDFIDLLRVRIGIADVVESSEIHSFKKLMADHAEAVPEGWYLGAYDELAARGHLAPVSHRANLGDASGRLSADGRWYLQSDSD